MARPPRCSGGGPVLRPWQWDFRVGGHLDILEVLGGVLSTCLPEGPNRLYPQTGHCHVLWCSQNWHQECHSAQIMQAVCIASGCFRTRANRGFYKERLGDVKGALDDYNQALQLNRRYCKALVLRGLLRQRHFRHFEAALEDFDSALRANPGYIAAYINRAVVKSEHMGDTDGALKDLDTVLQVLAPAQCWEA